MKSLFNLDNPFFQMLSRVADFILLNLLFILCSLPVITLGASLAGLHKVMQDYVFDTDGQVYRRFFSAFKENFKQATIVWLITLVIILGLGADLLLIQAYFTGTLATVMYVLLAILALLCIGILNFLFPLIVRYNNTLREHLFNAIILAICKLPRTLLMCLITVLPVLLLFFSPMTFVRTLVFWVFIGISFVVYIDNSILRPVFRELERVQQGEGSVSIMK